MVLYDDTDNISNENIKRQLQAIENKILDTGRKSKTFFIRTSHIPASGLTTRHILLETHAVTLYPSTLGGQSLKYLLQDKFGLDKQQIEKIKNIGDKSRWVTLYTSVNPRVILSEHAVYLQKVL
jgi:hypothetical protein